MKECENESKAEGELDDFRSWISAIIEGGGEFEEFPSNMLKNPIMISLVLHHTHNCVTHCVTQSCLV